MKGLKTGGRQKGTPNKPKKVLNKKVKKNIPLEIQNNDMKLSNKLNKSWEAIINLRFTNYILNILRALFGMPLNYSNLEK